MAVRACRLAAVILGTGSAAEAVTTEKETERETERERRRERERGRRRGRSMVEVGRGGCEEGPRTKCQGPR
jgi:hypothetical protein